MNKEELLDILYGKEKADAWKRFQIVEQFIDDSNQLYEYFDEIEKMLHCEQSYLRLRGFRLICRLAKWDEEQKIAPMIEELLQVIEEEKPTKVRLCLDALPFLLSAQPKLSQQVKQYLIAHDLSKYKDTMRPLIQKDIEQILQLEV